MLKQPPIQTSGGLTVLKIVLLQRFWKTKPPDAWIVGRPASPGAWIVGNPTLRSAGFSEIRAPSYVFGNPGLRWHGFLESQISGGLDFRKSDCPGLWIVGNPTLRGSGFSEIRATGKIVGYPGLRRFGFSEIRTSGGMDFWNSKSPQPSIFQRSELPERFSEN